MTKVPTSVGTYHINNLSVEANTIVIDAKTTTFSVLATSVEQEIIKEVEVTDITSVQGKILIAPSRQEIEDDSNMPWKTFWPTN